MNEHTPGPWRVIYNTDYYGDDLEPEDIANRYVSSIEGADGKIVYYTEDGYFKGKPADVAIIAAAPAMLEALEAIQRAYMDDYSLRRTLGTDILDATDAAIALARGTAEVSA